MARISLRYRASRTGLYSAAPGQTDLIADQLARVADQIDTGIPAEGDPYTQSIRPAAQEAASSIERGRAFLFEVADAVDTQQKALSGFIAGRKKAADQEVAPSGFGRVADREAAVAARARQIEVEILTTTAQDTISADAIQSKAVEISEAAVENLQQLERVVTASQDDWMGPSALRMGPDVTVEAMMKCATLGRELAAMHPSKVLDLFQGYVERGQADKANALIDAYAVEIPYLKTQPPGKLLQQFGTRNPRADEPTELRTLFDQLQRGFDQFRDATMPQSIVVGATVSNALRALFAEVFGISPRLMDGAKFAREFLSTDNALKRMGRDPLTIADDFLWRRLPGVPGAILPSGWSPIVRTQGGIKYRKSA